MALDTSKMYPLLPLRDAVVFPHTTRRILVGRDMSLRALEYAESHNNEIVLVAQRDVSEEELKNPMLDLYSVGVMAHVSNVMPFPNGCVKVVLEGEEVVDLRSILMADGFLNVTVSPRKQRIGAKDKTALFDEVLTRFREYATKRNIAEGMVDAFFGMDNQVNAYYGMIPFLAPCADGRFRRQRERAGARAAERAPEDGAAAEGMVHYRTDPPAAR